ncbi:hypothetical protein WKW80_10925 [Variovorax humicola]|uniref:Uncharacterized protein n=1 Tax=Variovorax humicola TaxID=1769758 RepID=A0ABU8VZB6_9BURK
MKKRRLTSRGREFANHHARHRQHLLFAPPAARGAPMPGPTCRTPR